MPRVPLKNEKVTVSGGGERRGHGKKDRAMPMASPQTLFAVFQRSRTGQAQRPLPRPPQHHHFLGALSLWERLHFAPKRHCPFFQ